MTIADDKIALIEGLAPRLLKMTETAIDQAIDTGDILAESAFYPKVEGPFGQFYAPFDWVNEDADVVLIGITPGKRQAKTALKALRRAIVGGRSPGESAELAKQAASFEGEMREIATQLMDRFLLNRIFGLKTCADLFGAAKQRAHYTSLLRYPVLHRQTRTIRRVKRTAWFDYSGGQNLFTTKLLVESKESDFVREIVKFGHAWLVPFGRWPAAVLRDLVARRLLDPQRILAGINHPSPGQKNRHRCQLNRTDDHSGCTKNVGCEGLRKVTRELETKVAAILA
jgi:hypothetical protein